MVDAPKPDLALIRSRQAFRKPILWSDYGPHLVKDAESGLADLLAYADRLEKALKQISDPGMNPSGPAYGAIQIAKRALREGGEHAG